MKRLIKYMKGYEKECVLGPLFKLFEATLELLVPLVVAAVIDNGISAGNRRYITLMCLLMAGLGLVGLLFSVTAQFFSARAAVGFVARVRRALFAHIQKLSFSQLDRLGVANMVNRMTSDINQIQNGVNLTLRLLLRSPFVVFGAMIMAFTIDARSAVSFVVLIPLLSAAVFGVMLATMPLHKRVQAALDNVLRAVRENITGVRVIRAFGREQTEREQFDSATGELFGLQRCVGRISAIMNPATYVLVNGAVIALIYTGALRVDAGIITQGAVIALYNYMSQILTELVKLANLIITITKALACANRVADTLELPEGMPEREVKEGRISDSMVEFRGVTLRYHEGSQPALRDISFSVSKGETIGIIGGTGSGKSSLVQLIPRCYDADSGQVLVRGVDVREYDPAELRRHIGFVMQYAGLFSGSIRDNLLWGAPDAPDEELWRALDIAQARSVVEEKEGGLDYITAQGGHDFSGGQKQRLTIARALVGSPDILILDDSFSALDYATDAALRRALHDMGGDQTIFIVSQRTSSIRAADRIIVLDEGSAVDIGTHEELLERCPVYREIYESQFSGEDERA